MIQTLLIENFQSHKRTEIEFSPNLTVIIGLNNYGKSAVIRALKKVVRDEPDGNVFIRDGENELHITLNTNKGKIERLLRLDGGSDANKYVVNDTLEFVKFSKTGIPVEVLSVLNISDYQKFGDFEFDMNFQNQFDNLFLIVGQGLPSIRGKVLSKITGIDKIQRAIQLVGVEEKKLGQEIKRLDIDLLQLHTDLLRYDNLPYLLELQKDVIEQSKKYEDQNIFIDFCKEKYNGIREISQSARKIKRKLSILDIPLFEVDVIEEIQKRIAVARDAIFLSNEISVRGDIISVAIEDTTENLESLLNCIKIMSICDKLFCKINEVENVCQIEIPISDNIVELQESLKNLTHLQMQLNNLDSGIKGKTNELEECLNKETQLLNEQMLLQQQLKVCPICDRPF